MRRDGGSTYVIAVFDLLFLVYSVVMDVLYGKVYYIWLLQKIISKAHDEYEKIT